MGQEVMDREVATVVEERFTERYAYYAGEQETSRYRCT
jgi:hypothetical protein